MVTSKLKLVGIIVMAGVVIGLLVWGGYWKIQASKKDVRISELIFERDGYKTVAEEAKKINTDNEEKYAASIEALQLRLQNIGIQAEQEKERLIKMFEDYKEAETVDTKSIPQGVLDETTSKKRIVDRNDTINDWNLRVW